MSKRGNGEGSIYQMSDGRWRAAVSIGFKEGKPLRKTFTAATRAEVARELAKALRDRQTGALVPADRQTLGQFLDWWLEKVIKSSVRPKTWKFYEFQCRVHIKPGLGSIPIQRLNAQQVQDFLNGRLSFKSERTGRTLSARVVRHIYRTLCTALNAAEKYKLVPSNVALSADPPRAPKQEMRFMSVEQARAFLETARLDRQYALYATVLSVGLRLGEALAVSWDSIDLDSGRLQVRQSLQRCIQKLDGATGFRMAEPKGGYSRRAVRLPAIALQALRHHRTQQEQEREWAGSGWKGTHWNLVFTNPNGTPLHERNVLRHFQRLLALAGLPKMRLHDLRHSAVAILIAQGVNVKAISELLGHSTVGFTLQVYGHLLEETKQETADKMDAALNPVATNVATTPTSAKPN